MIYVDINCEAEKLTYLILVLLHRISIRFKKPILPITDVSYFKPKLNVGQKGKFCKWKPTPDLNKDDIIDNIMLEVKRFT